jgi:hypothetical protein
MKRYVIEHRLIVEGLRYGELLGTYDSMSQSPFEALDEARSAIKPPEGTFLRLRPVA